MLGPAFGAGAGTAFVFAGGGVTGAGTLLVFGMAAGTGKLFVIAVRAGVGGTSGPGVVAELGSPFALGPFLFLPLPVVSS